MKRHGWELVVELRLSGPEKITDNALWMASNPGPELFPTYLGSSIIRPHHLTDALCDAPPEGVIARVSNEFTYPLDRQVATELASRTLAGHRETLLSKLMSGQIRSAESEKVMEAAA